MAEVAQAVVALIPSAKGFGQATQRELAGQMRGTGKKQGVGIGRRLAGGMAAGIVAAGGAGFILKSVVGEASSLEQSVGGLKAVFKGSFGEMNKESQRAAKNLGLSKNEYNELATVLGAGLKNKGIKDYADQTQGLIGVGADLAAQFGGSTQEAVDALAAAMRGESDPIERYGISLNESAISAELARKGQDDLKGAALEQAKTQARLTLISKQSADAQGAFGRESNTLAGQQQRLGAQVDNVKAKLGEALLPVLTDAASLLNDKVVPAVSTFIDEWRNSTGVGGQVRDVVMRVGSALKTVATFLWDHKEAVAALLVAYAGFKVVMATMRAYRAVMLAVKGAQLGYAAATYGAVGASMAQTRAEKLGLAVGKAKLFFTKAVTVATNAWAVAQRVLNAVLRMNPIGLVITALTLLVGGMVLAYKKSETFRRIVDGAWRGIKKAALSVVSWFKNTAWPWMKNAFQWIGDKAKWLWGQIRDAWNWIKGKIKSVVDWFKNVAWPSMKAVFKAIGDAGKWLWSNALKPAFNWIKDGAKAVFGWIKDVGWPWVKGAFDNIKAAAGWLWDKMKWAFNKIKGGAQSLKDKVGWLRDWVKRYFEAIKGNADWLWDKVKLAFDKLKGGVAAVKKAFETAKDGIGEAWGKVYGKITSPIKKAIRWLNKNFIGKLNSLMDGIGVSFEIPEIGTKGWATGGYTGAGSKYAPAGVVHKDEFVLRKEATNKLRKTVGLSGLDYMNRTGEMPGYAGGGLVYKEMSAWLRRNVPGAAITSGYRPGAITARGTPSDHGAGRAIDIAPSMATFNAIKSAFGKAIKSLIYSPANGRQVLNGRNHFYTQPDRGNHWDHIHWAMNSMSGGAGLPGWASNPLEWVKDKIAGLTKGFDSSKYGLAGHVLPAIFDKVSGAVAGKVKDAAAALLDFGGDSAGTNLSIKGGGGSGATRLAVRKVAEGYGWGKGAQWDALDWIIQRESSWDLNAANSSSSARGLFQKMTSVHGPVESSASGQARWGLKYIRERYGSPIGAKAFWERNHWYDKGGLVKPAVFDNGGTLAPGLNLVNNKLGKPEPLVRPEHAFAGMELTGTLDTPWGPAEVRGIVKDELVSQARQARVQGAR